MKNLKPALPHFVAVLIFVILGSIYFFPQFQGNDLYQSDVQHHIGMSKEIADFRQQEDAEPLWTNAMFGGMPAYQISMSNPNLLTATEGFVIFKVFKGPLGYLLVAMISFYILLLCFSLNPWPSIMGAIAFGFSTIHILFLAGGHNSKVHAIALIPGIIGALIYAYRKNFRIGGVLLSVFVCLEIAANHIQETYYLLFLIAAIVSVEFYRFYKTKTLPVFFKISTFLLLATGIGVLPTMSNLLLTEEYSKFTIRGPSELSTTAVSNNDKQKSNGLTPDYIKEYNLGDGEIWSLAIPNVKGGASGYLGNYPDKIYGVAPEYKNYVVNTNAYWGEQYSTGGAFYFGASVFLLFILGMVFIKDPIKWAFLAVTALAVLLSWKSSIVLDWFIDYMPLFNKFRDTKMTLVLAQLAFPLIGLLFLNELLKNQLDKKKLVYTISATVGLFVLFYIMPTVWFTFFNTEEITNFEKQAAMYPQQIDQLKEEIQKVRVSIFQDDVLRSLCFMILTGGSIILYNRKRFSANYLIIPLTLLVLFDLWAVNKRYLNNKKEARNYERWVDSYSKANPFKASFADYEILKIEVANNAHLTAKMDSGIRTMYVEPKHQDTEKEKLLFSTLNLETNYRVFTLQNPFTDVSVSYYHKSIGGYHGAKLKKYQELIDSRINKEYAILLKVLKSNNDTTIRFALEKQLPTLNMLNTRYIIYNPEAAPIKNSYTYGSAWFIKNLRIVNSQDEEIQALDSTDPRHTAVTDKHYIGSSPVNFKFDSLATINNRLYRPNHLVYETNAHSQQLAVFSEIYYKDGWNAYVDGKPAAHFKADYVLRAMAVPAGKHIIEFKFEPATYYLSKKISYAGSALILLFAASMLFIEHKKNSQ